MKLPKSSAASRWMLMCVALVMCMALGSAASNGNQHTAEFVVVIHADNPNEALPRAQVDAMFLGKVKEWPNGAKVLPVNNRDKPIREQFCDQLRARSIAAVDAYWAAKMFGDFVAPPGRLDDQELVQFVASNTGAIGYVSHSTSLNGVKQLKITDQ